MGWGLQLSRRVDSLLLSVFSFSYTGLPSFPVNRAHRLGFVRDVVEDLLCLYGFVGMLRMLSGQDVYRHVRMYIGVSLRYGVRYRGSRHYGVEAYYQYGDLPMVDSASSPGCSWYQVSWLNFGLLRCVLLCVVFFICLAYYMYYAIRLST